MLGIKQSSSSLVERESKEGKENNMKKYWFSSDYHLGHAKVIKYCNRPFSSVEEMDETIIRNHNSIVGQEDKFYFLGDFAWRNIGKYVERLNGNIHLIKGSHDKQIGNYSTLFTTVKDLDCILIEGYKIVLCHYAMRVWQVSHFNSWQLFGHSHNRLEPVGKQLDVGVDGHNFYPWSFEEVKEYMKDRPDNVNLVERMKK